MDVLLEWCKNPGSRVLLLEGTAGSMPALLAAACLSEGETTQVFILPDRETAAYFHNDIENLFPSLKLHFFPSSYKRSVQFARKSKDNLVQRTETLQRIRESSGRQAVVTFPEAIVEMIVSGDFMEKNAFTIRRGDKLSHGFLAEFLESCHFQHVDFVYEPGQYSIRGSIIDVFSYSARLPWRIDFYGEQVDTIRSFNIENQLSVEKFDHVSLVPDLARIHAGESSEGLVSMVEALGTTAIWWTQDLAWIRDRMDDIVSRSLSGRDIDEETDIPLQPENLVDGKTFTARMSTGTVIEFGRQVLFPPDVRLKFNTESQPPFRKHFDILADDLNEKREKGYRTCISSDNPKQIERLRAIFNDTRPEVEFEALSGTLHEGFVDHLARLCVYTDHQIFDRYHRYRLQEQFTRRDSINIRELTELQPGDYVVHIDHGIGQFGGLQKIDLDGRIQEAVKLVYKDQDTLFVSIHSLHRISKYKGKDNQPPRIYKLGTGAWQKLKSRTKKKVKDIARELISLYARRKAQKGFSFSPDSYLQNELEASFIYEDTEDQLRATREMKEGMEAGFPMDRLVCGDVGFGKTEVAVRGAFKAVSDSKQVAVLVPTTILALQHYKTFSDRLKNFPCNVDYISRLKSSSAQKKALADLESGKTDIIIGTHRLVSKDVTFRDLGLLIIDEEQKFGVSIKEKLKQIKFNVDTMTLTATPIPRTLQMSLMGARDLSIIRTPPPNRYPIATELHTFSEDIIREAIYAEVSRNGQVFFIHNRIENIARIEEVVKRLCPDVKTVVAHGQMEGAKLEKIMLGFIEGEYDVLVSTTIIESGLDIPNANTIIINDAHHFGLSDLHQLRGRVGRSNRKAFCYLLAPPLNLQTPEARRRLKAIEEFSEIGSGLNIAMQDLDIRGSGNMLGAEQSGFIAEIGFDTYHRILDEAILELKDNEYRDLFPEEGSGQREKAMYVSDCQIESDMSLLFPDEYIENHAERLRLYRVLNSINNSERLNDFEKEMEDRFGSLPEPSRELMNVVRLRWLSQGLGFEKIILRKGRMVIHFISNPESTYFSSQVFRSILDFVQRHGKTFNMKETGSRLTMSRDNVTSVAKAIEILGEIQ